ncbi:MAG: peptidylprolyl isomerase, partial [Alphaproteobacteria bacterium]
EASQGTPEYLFSEIFLVVESTEKDTVVRQNAERLVEQVRAGADFGVLARQFSEGVSAEQAGSVGWVPEDQLAEEVATTLAALEPGKISAPVRTSGGYLIVRLHDRRQSLVPDLDEAKVTLKQVLLQASAAASEETRQLALAESIRKTIGDCNDMDRAAAEIGSDMSGDLGTVRLRDLPPDLREVVRELPVGTVSAPVRTKLGVQLLMVCDRVDPATNLPDREQVRNALIEKQFELLSRRYLRNLRRDAFVDIRI